MSPTMKTTLHTLVVRLDALNDCVGRAAAWLTLAMAVVTFIVVTLRYGFNMGWIWMQESVVFMHGVLFMLTAGYTLLKEGHVRVDILYRPGGAAYKAAVDLLGH